MTRPLFELTVAGFKVERWKRATLTRTLGSLAVTGQFTAIDMGLGDELPYSIGNEATIRIDGVDQISGFVRDLDKPTEATRGEVTVTISSKSTDLTECSVDRGGWKKATPRIIATDLVADYGLRVLGTDAALDKQLPKFQVRPGEKVARALQRLGDQLRLMVTADTKDGVVFAQAGGLLQAPVRTQLAQPGNVIAGQLRLSDRGQFSPLIVRGQSRGADNAYGDTIRGASAQVEDANVFRHRPLVITAPGRGQDLEAIAEWERARRYGEASNIRHTVQGFSHNDGPWEPNRIVAVNDGSARVRGEMLITRVTFTQSASTARTTLALARVEAFLPKPPKKKKKGAGL